MSFKKTTQDIKSLKIQGAQNVATTGIRLLRIRHTARAVKKILSLRPTEPLLFNAISLAKKNRYKNLNQILKHFKESQEKIAKIGSRKIRKNSIVFTHCHSSTVMDVIREAKKTKNFHVYNTETRPLFQGRKTAKEVSKMRIPVTHFVDSAARHYLKEADIVLLGADAINAKGDVINKIGSEMITDLAKENKIPVYVCADSWKFDPKTLRGKKVRIEQRKPKEVWEKAPRRVNVENPAFEKIPAGDITGIISELGILKPKQFVSKVKRNYPWIQGQR